MAKLILPLLILSACHKKAATEPETYIIRDDVLESLNEDAFDSLPEAEQDDTASPEEQDLLDEES